MTAPKPKSVREAAQAVVAEDSIPYSESVIEVRTERIIELRAALEREEEECVEIVAVLNRVDDFTAHDPSCGTPCDCGLVRVRKRMSALIARLSEKE